MQDRWSLQKGNIEQARQLSWLGRHKVFSSQYLDWYCLAFEVHTGKEKGKERQSQNVPITQLLPALSASSAAFRHLGLDPRVS